MSARARQLSAAQIESHTYVTRGMRKNAVPFAEQITQGRSGEQTHQRQVRSCVSCGGPRNGSFPICGNCNGGRGQA